LLSPQVSLSKLKTLLFHKSYPDSSSPPSPVWNWIYAINHHIGFAIDLELGMAIYQPFPYLLLFPIGATASIFKKSKEHEIGEAIAKVLPMHRIDLAA